MCNAMSCVEWSCEVIVRVVTHDDRHVVGCASSIMFILLLQKSFVSFGDECSKGDNVTLRKSKTL